MNGNSIGCSDQAVRILSKTSTCFVALVQFLLSGSAPLWAQPTRAKEPSASLQPYKPGYSKNPTLCHDVEETYRDTLKLLQKHKLKNPDNLVGTDFGTRIAPAAQRHHLRLIYGEPVEPELSGDPLEPELSVFHLYGLNNGNGPFAMTFRYHVGRDEYDSLTVFNGPDKPSETIIHQAAVANTRYSNQTGHDGFVIYWPETLMGYSGSPATLNFLEKDQQMYVVVNTYRNPVLYPSEGAGLLNVYQITNTNNSKILKQCVIGKF